MGHPTFSETEVSPSLVQPIHTDLNYTAHTYAVSTECQVYRPTCQLDNDKQINTCWPLYNFNNSEVILDAWNRSVWNTGFLVSTWKTRLQTMLALKGDLVASDQSNGEFLSNGANLNPFTTMSFGCFSDYGFIPFNNTNISSETPFINWWTCMSDLLFHVLRRCLLMCPYVSAS